MATEEDKERFANANIRRYYRGIPHDLLDTYQPILEHECRGSYLVLQFIYRQTIGFYQKSKILPVREIAAGIGWPPPTVVDRLKRLFEWGFIEREQRLVKIGRNRLETETYEWRIADKIVASIFRPGPLDPDNPEDPRLAYIPPEFQHWLEQKGGKK